MIWILLAALGVPVWFVVGALAASFWNRKRFQKSPGAFKCLLRRLSDESHGKQTSWPSMPAYARWVHDVLIVHVGVALVRTQVFPIASIERMDDSDAVPAPKRLGANPSIIRLRLDDGSVMVMAVPANAAVLQRGPFTPAGARPVAMRAI